jgi:hypothetical protein
MLTSLPYLIFPVKNFVSPSTRLPLFSSRLRAPQPQKGPQSGYDGRARSACEPGTLTAHGEVLFEKQGALISKYILTQAGVRHDHVKRILVLQDIYFHLKS